jgi:hypothetical protein
MDYRVKVLGWIWTGCAGLLVAILTWTILYKETSTGKPAALNPSAFTVKCEVISTQ